MRARPGAHGPRRVRHVLRALGDARALDLTSETLADALQRREQFRGRLDEEEQAWLFAMRTQLSRYWRRGRVERAALRRVAVDVPALSDAEIERIRRLAGLRELRPELVQAIGELPADQRRAVELRIVGELEYRELAATMGVSEQVARAGVGRAAALAPPARAARGDADDVMLSPE